MPDDLNSMLGVAPDAPRPTPQSPAPPSGGPPNEVGRGDEMAQSNLPISWLEKRPAERSRPGDETAAYLDYLRAQSSCKDLRGSITSTFWFNIILWLVFGIGCIVVLVHPHSSELAETEAKAGVVFVFFAVNALVVYRQVATMVVTFVDSNVLRNRDRYVERRNEPPKSP